jgi:hypothetical protein
MSLLLFQLLVAFSMMDTSDTVSVASTESLASTVCPEIDPFFNERELYLHNLTQTKDQEICAAVQKLTNLPFVEKIATHLHAADLLESFIDLVNCFANNCLIDNIAIRCALERAKLQCCQSTSCMRYSEKTTEFWFAAYKLCGGPAIRLFCGPKHSRLQSTHETPGHYDPATSQLNFAVPSIMTLTSFGGERFADIQPGIIPGTVEQLKKLVSQGKQFVLSFDGKYVGQGLKGDDMGDENLWGYEGPPSLSARKEEKNNDLILIKSLQENVQNDGSNVFQVHTKLVDLLRSITSRIQKLRHACFAKRKKKNELQEKVKLNPSLNFSYAISAISTFVYQCDSLVRRGLQINERIASACAYTFSAQFPEQHTLLSVQKCSRFLRLKSPEQNEFLITNGPRTDFVKQGTELWHELRRKSRVTGSTAYNAAGLRNLAAQKKHYSEHILGKKRTISPALQAKFDYGNENEINAMATIAQKLLPALTPPCHFLQEVGPLLLDSVDKEEFLEISADGIIGCTCTGYCIQGCTPGATQLVVEVKCPDVSKIWTNDPRYCLPIYYSCQILLEMLAHNVTICWYVTYTKESTTLQEVKFNADVCTDLTNLLYDLYGGDEVSKPVHLHEGVSSLKKKLQIFTETHVSLIAEVQSITCSNDAEDENVNHDIDWPFTQKNDVQYTIFVAEELQQKLNDITVECETIVQDSFSLERQKATEIFLFMMSDLDRITKEDKTPYTFPLCYAMKGNSLSGEKLREMLRDVENFLQHNKIPLSCQVFDGQWSHVCLKTKCGKPLTLLQLQKYTWNQVSCKNRAKVMETFMDISSTGEHFQDELANIKRYIHSISYPIGNTAISVKTKSSGEKVISIGSLGGKISFPGLMEQVKLHKLPTNLSPSMLTKLRTEKVVGLQVGERDIASLLNEDEYPDMDDDISCMNLNEDELPDLPEQERTTGTLHRILLSPACPLLRELCCALQKLNDKWLGIKPDDIYPSMLTTPSLLHVHCIKKDLETIGQVVEKYTGRKLFTSKAKKGEQVEIIAKAFGSQSAECIRAKQLPSLVCLCESSVKKLPLLWLQVSLAKTLHVKNTFTWKEEATAPLHAFIPHEKKYVDLYSYPELSLTTNLPLFRTMDVHHMLTNLRVHITQKGMKCISARAFRKVAETSKVISRAVMIDMVDKQNVEKAKKVFSSEVQAVLSMQGEHSEAKLCEVVRNWFRAVDERGIPSHLRVNFMWKFHRLLTKGIDFSEFPPPSFYVQGLPPVTFEAILQNISTRLQMYQVLPKKSYNQRAVSSLVCENYFSLVSGMGKIGEKCPSAAEIPRIMSDLNTLAYYRQKEGKIFHFDTSIQQTYPSANSRNSLEDICNSSDDETVHRVDEEVKLATMSSLENMDFVYTDHTFDNETTSLRRKRKRNVDVTFGNAPLRGVRSVRQKFHKLDESLVLPHVIYRLPPGYDD